MQLAQSYILIIYYTNQSIYPSRFNVLLLAYLLYIYVGCVIFFLFYYSHRHALFDHHRHLKRASRARRFFKDQIWQCQVTAYWPLLFHRLSESLYAHLRGCSMDRFTSERSYKTRFSGSMINITSHIDITLF